MSQPLYMEQINTFRATLGSAPGRAYDVYRLSLLYSLSPEEVTRERYRLGIHPKSPHDFYNLGALASKEGRHEEALRLYLKAEKAGGQFPELYYNLGLTYENLGDTPKAVVAYERFAELGKKSDSEEMSNEVRQVRAQIRQLKG